MTIHLQHHTGSCWRIHSGRSVFWLKLLACSLQGFFEDFQDKVSVREFNWGKEIKGTVLEGDAFFGSEQNIKAALPPGKMASYSDLVRYVLLHNYGGLW